jgi:hypothetical protein
MGWQFNERLCGHRLTYRRLDWNLTVAPRASLLIRSVGLLLVLTGLRDAKPGPQNKVKVVEEGGTFGRLPPLLRLDVVFSSFFYIFPLRLFFLQVLQASDPGDDIVPDLEVYIDKLQDEQPLLVKDRPSSPDLPSAPASVTAHETKVRHDGGCHHAPSASGHQLSSVHEDPQKCSTTPSLAPGAGASPRSADPPPLHSPRASGSPYRCYDGNNVTSVHSSPSGHSHHDRPSDKELSDAIFGASDEELSSLSDTESIFRIAQPSSGLAQSRRIIAGSDSSKRRSRSQRHRHPHLSAKRTSPTSDLTPAPDPTPKQKLAPVVKRLRVIDSQDSKGDKPSDRGTAAAKRKKILIDSEDETEPAACVPSLVKESPFKPTSDPSQEEKVTGKKRQSGVTTAEDRVTASERPRRACVATNSPNVGASVQMKSHTPVVVDQSNPNKAGSENELVGGTY